MLKIISKFLLSKTGKLGHKVALGALDCIAPNIKANKLSKVGGEGKVDKTRLWAGLVFTALLVSFAFGWVDKEQVKFIWDKLEFVIKFVFE